MDVVCPEIDRLTSCRTCGAQSLPPFRLCVAAHVACVPCAAYMSRCACGQPFAPGPHCTLDWLARALRHGCKYTAPGPAPSLSRLHCRSRRPHRRYSVRELREHYRTGCALNGFVCPLIGCGHVARVDTIVEHYEAAHGPYERLMSADPLNPNRITFKIRDVSWRTKEFVHKAFNGYFLFITKKSYQNPRNYNLSLSMQNINPSDLLKYTYNATVMSNEVMVTLSLNDSWAE
ncbi:uncharacterized protein LOC112692248 [Sipha flava]|uniref:Uncharacterized protein LOC112692248 n=1 Tax=Sipha flava TaxID=143950 RepID=A0A8B8GIA1_9HEMI|nr:uncharacterized protein LOC112692248 [Sipha flava]